MPEGSAVPSLHTLTRTFVDPRLEAEFRAEHFESAVRPFTRFSIALSSVVFLAYGLHDAYILHDLVSTAWAIRFGAFPPVAIAVLGATFARSYPRLHSGAMLAFGMTVNLVVIWIGAIAPPAGFFIYSSYAVLFVTLGPFIARMNVLTQIVYTLLSIALFVAFGVRVSHPSTAVLVSIATTIGAMGGIGAIVAAHIEGQAREMFVQRRTIRAQLVELDSERAKSEALLLNILPASVARRLKDDGRAIADGFAEVTVLFADIVGFTKLAERLSPVEVVRRLNQLFSTFDDLADELGVEKIKTIGDAYMAVAGLSRQDVRHAHTMAEMALGMLKRVSDFGGAHEDPLSIRIGLNTGPVVAGVIGKKKFIYDVWGDTVNTASRMESHGGAGHIHVTEETRQRLADSYVFEARGEIDVKGKGPMRTHYLVARK
jgi:class 3 adenylate cyclase